MAPLSLLFLHSCVTGEPRARPCTLLTQELRWVQGPASLPPTGKQEGQHDTRAKRQPQRSEGQGRHGDLRSVGKRLTRENWSVRVTSPETRCPGKCVQSSTTLPQQHSLMALGFLSGRTHMPASRLPLARQIPSQARIFPGSPSLASEGVHAEPKPSVSDLFKTSSKLSPASNQRPG